MQTSTFRDGYETLCTGQGCQNSNEMKKGRLEMKMTALKMMLKYRCVPVVSKGPSLLCTVLSSSSGSTPVNSTNTQCKNGQHLEFSSSHRGNCISCPRYSSAVILSCLAVAIVLIVTLWRCLSFL